MMQNQSLEHLKERKIGTKCCSNNERNGILQFFALEIPPGMEMSCFTSSRLKEMGRGVDQPVLCMPKSGPEELLQSKHNKAGLCSREVKI